MYSPSLGRFLQTDPIGYADGMNWYNYVGSDPVNAIDPSGLDAKCGTGYHFVPSASIGQVIVGGGDGGDGSDSGPITVNSMGHCEPDANLPKLAPVVDSTSRPKEYGGKPQKPKPSACDVAAHEPGKILYAGGTGTLAAWIAGTGAIGHFSNLTTGTSSFYVTVGGGAGFEAAASGYGGVAPSMSQFLGWTGNISGSVPGWAGSVGVNGGGVGASTGPSAGAGATATATYTFIFGCTLGGG